MKYNAPLDKLPEEPDASYVNGDPGMGIKGSIVSAESVELDQREIVEVIFRANARAYADFDDVLCAAPINTDPQQLRKAIEGFIKSYVAPQQFFFIDTDVTKTVHGPGADFADLHEAMEWLNHYKITTRGWVHFVIAAGQWVYTKTIRLRHPDIIRVNFIGATMTGPMITIDDFQWTNFYTQLTDHPAQLQMLRQRLPTELRFTNGTLMMIDGGTSLTNCLVSSDGSSNAFTGGALLAMQGGQPDNVQGLSNVAVHGAPFAGIGVMGDLWTFGGFVSASGCQQSGWSVSGNVTCAATQTISCANLQDGWTFSAPGTTQMYVGCKVYNKANKRNGMWFLNGASGRINGHWARYNEAVAVRASGAHIDMSNSTTLLNIYGMYAEMGGNIYAVGSSGPPSSMGPPYNTVGNSNSFITV